MQRIPPTRSMLAVVFAAAVALPVSAQDWKELIQGAPQGANAIGLIDVSFLRDQSQNSSSVTEMLETLKGVLSDHVVRGAFVAELNLDTMEPAWEAGLAVTTKYVTPEKIAKATSGYIDNIEGMKVVWTPKNTFLSLVGEDRVIAYRPANRKAVAKILRDKKANGPHPLSAFLASVVNRGTNKTPVTIGLDLTDVISPGAIKEKLATLASLAGADVTIDQVAKLLVDLEGVVLTVSADEKGTATIRIQFRSSPVDLQKVGKAMFVEILGRANAALPEIADWRSIVEGNTLILTGKLSKGSLSHILSLFNTPFAIGTMHSYASAMEGSSDQSESQRVLLATKRYFGSVNKIIENVRGFSAQTLGQRALWCDREGRKIDQLPLLDVDPDMLNYGGAVSALLRGTGLTMRNVNMKAATMQDNSMVSAGGGYGYGWGGYSWGGGLPSAGYNAGAAARDTANINLAAQQNLAGQGAYLEAMGKIDQMTPDIRRRMTERYRVEF